MQCMNMMDINNDGHLDVFGCHDDSALDLAERWQRFVVYNNYINFATRPLAI